MTDPPGSTSNTQRVGRNGPCDFQLERFWNSAPIAPLPREVVLAAWRTIVRTHSQRQPQNRPRESNNDPVVEAARLSDVANSHEISWSPRRLAARRRLPRAVTSWALDSGGFTELRLHGGWRTTAAEYAAAVRRYRDEIGRLEWAAPQDWMCEPFMLAKTGLSIAAHQLRTVANYLELRSLAPDLPFVPVLQGWSLDDYRRCTVLFDEAGVDLTTEPRVGVGSVCRRQATGEIEAIVHSLALLGLRLHGLGVKAGGLLRYADCLVSADSLAWSFDARRAAPLAGCSHANCANCLRYAAAWRERALARLDAVQLHMRMAG
jgi:hypothetical protein